MATFIDCNLGAALSLGQLYQPPAGDFRIEVKGIPTFGESGSAILLQRNSSPFPISLKIENKSDFGGRSLVSLRLNNEGAGAHSVPAVLNEGEVHEVIVTRTGDEHRFYIDGVEMGSTSPLINPPPYPTIYLNDASSFDRVLREGEAAQFQLEYVKWYGSADQSNLLRSWEAAASDTSNTGAQPILVETVSGDHATGEGFPTDGSAFITAALSPELTATNPPQGGEVFSFSGANYAAQPTGPMTFTQGTRTISVPVTISNWDAAEGTFTGVTNDPLPGVPASGASATPALLYEVATDITLPDPGE